MSRGPVRRRSLAISAAARDVCVFRTLTCLHRTDSGPGRDTLRAISTVCFALARFGPPRLPRARVSSVNPLLHWRLLKTSRKYAAGRSFKIVCLPGAILHGTRIASSSANKCIGRHWCLRRQEDRHYLYLR